MKNVPNRATGEAMPSLTRRLFLRGAAIIAPLAALPAIPALAASASDYVEENPALLDAEPALNLAEAEMIAASKAYDEAVRIGTPLWPRAPEEITYRGNHYAMERDLEGRGYDSDLSVEPSDDLRDNLKRLMRKRKVTLDVEEARAFVRNRLAVAEAYEAACEAARATSGIVDARARRKAAVETLEAAIHIIHREPAKTMAGVRIKARAIQAWNHAPLVNRMFLAEGHLWAPDLAASVLEILNA